MIYTKNTKKALRLCYEAHNGQLDKGGAPYVFHPMHLAEQMTTEEATIVALLHDVVEDTKYTLADIAALGFGDSVIEALALLTHDKSVSYNDYIAEIKSNDIAKQVKLADLAHNADLTRLNVITEKDIARREKYLSSICTLSTV
jgi:(p)ppGpp synthase/HD superfamily hydrolase